MVEKKIPTMNFSFSQPENTAYCMLCPIDVPNAVPRTLLAFKGVIIQ